jgi:hypothetical protein
VTNKPKGEQWVRLNKMKQKIDGIQGLVLELKALGEGVPVVEKNVQAMLNLTYVLRSSISDVAEVMDQKRR